MRQVDADDVRAVARELVHLRPHQAATRARLVLDDGLDRRAALFQHHLLVAGRKVRLAAGREGLPVVDALVGTGLGVGDRCKGEAGEGKQLFHSGSLLGYVSSFPKDTNEKGPGECRAQTSPHH